MRYVATYATGRCRSGIETGGTLYHAVPTTIHNDYEYVSGWGKSLCGYTPGKKSNGWSDYRHGEVTCPKCTKRLEKMNDATATTAV